MSVKVDSGLRRRYNLVRKTNLANLVRLKEAQAMQVNMLDAKTNLSSLVKLLETGEEEAIVIARAGKPEAKLVGYDEVDVSKRVYLTRNGHGAYTIMSIEEADELDRLRAVHTLLSDLKEAEDKADREGWISDEEMQKEMGLSE